MGVSKLSTLTEVKEKEQRLYCCSVWSSVMNTYLIFVCSIIFIGILLTYIYNNLCFLLSGIYREETFSCYPVPTWRHGCWFLVIGVRHWLYNCCTVRISQWGVYVPSNNSLFSRNQTKIHNDERTKSLKHNNALKNLNCIILI